MKNFKVIISLVMLIAASNASAAQQARKREYQPRAAQKKTLPVTQYDRPVPPIPARQREYTRPVPPIPAGQQYDRPVPPIPAAAEKAAQEAWEKASIGGRDISVPVGLEDFGWTSGLDKESLYFKVADIFYDQDRKTIKEAGIKKYVEMVQAAYPDFTRTELIMKAYEDASKILQVARRDTNLGMTSIYKKFYDSLYQMISLAVEKALSGSKQTTVSTTPPKLPVKSEILVTKQPETISTEKVVISKQQSPAKALELIKKELVQIKPEQQFIYLVPATAKKENINAFIIDNKFQPQWFDFALTLLKNSGKFSKENLPERLFEYAQKSYNFYVSKEETTQLDQAIEKLIQKEIDDALARSKGIEKKK
jgi:hypothetical protein